jgi:hypothetical protein
MRIRNATLIFLAGSLLAVSLSSGHADARPDPFAPFGMSGYAPFTRVDPVKPKPKIRVSPPNMASPKTSEQPLPPVAPLTPRPMPLVISPPQAPETKSWTVIGLVQGDTVPQAILMAGQETYVVSIGDFLPDGSAKLVSIDNVSVALRSKLSKADIRIAVGSTGQVPITNLSHEQRL